MLENYYVMDKKDLFKIVIKIILYAVGLFAAYFGVGSLVSCTVNRSLSSQGKATIVTVDTTVINHDGSIKFPRQ